MNLPLAIFHNPVRSRYITIVLGLLLVLTACSGQVASTVQHPYPDTVDTSIGGDQSDEVGYETPKAEPVPVVTPDSTIESFDSGEQDTNSIGDESTPIPVQTAEPATSVPPENALEQAPLPVMFIENVGQFDDRARYQVKGDHATIFVAEDGLWLTLKQCESSSADPIVRHSSATDEPGTCQAVGLHVSFVDANPNVLLEAFNPLESSVNYLVGDQNNWQSHVPAWGGIRYRNLYPGIDLEITGDEGVLSQVLIVEPDADLSLVRLQVDGADSVSMENGILQVQTSLGFYQLPLINVDPTVLSAQLTAEADSPNIQGNIVSQPFTSADVSISSSANDTNIDLIYSTFLGGSGIEEAFDIAVDSSGAAYIVGYEDLDGDFPTTVGAYQTTNSGLGDVVIAKINASGSSLVYATYVGGSLYDEGYGIDVDSSGAAYVTGITGSFFDFPTTTGAFQESVAGDYDVFVIKLQPDGSDVVYSTVLGGSGSNEEWGNDIVVDSSGNAYITGVASSAFPSTPGVYQPEKGFSRDAFVAQLNSTGSDLVFSTLLGATGNEEGKGIALDSSGNIFVTGYTDASDFPTTVGAYQTTLATGQDTFVTKFNTDGSALLFSTLLGGDGWDHGNGIVVDSSGKAIITGWTTSSDFPVTYGAYLDCAPGGSDAFVAKFNISGSATEFVTRLGGTANDRGYGITLLNDDSVYVTGWTLSADFPVSSSAFQSSSSPVNGFISRINSTGDGLPYSSNLGGGANDYAYGIASDSDYVYVAGYTFSSSFPTSSGAVDSSYSGNGDLFATKLAIRAEGSPTPPTCPPQPTPTPTPTPAPEIIITHIEITQGIQDPLNSLPLVAGKPTVARVYIKCTGCDKDWQAEGKLYATLGGDPLSPVSVDAINTIGVDQDPDWEMNRSEQNKSLNFILPSSPSSIPLRDWTMSGAPILLKAEVTSEDVQGDVMYIDASFEPERKIVVGYIPIRFDGKLPRDEDMLNNDLMAEKLFPVTEIEYIPLQVEPIEWNFCLEDSLLRCPFPLYMVNSFYLRKKLTEEYRFAKGIHPDLDFVVGWLPDRTVSGGKAKGNVLYADASVDGTLDYGEYYFAHEVGHLLGLKHIPNVKDCAGGDEDWLYPDSGIQEYGVEIEDAGIDISVKLPTTKDFMYCHPRVNVWISPYSYNKLDDILQFYLLAANLPAYQSAQSYQVTSSDYAIPYQVTQPYFIISGVIYTDDTAELDPVWNIDLPTLDNLPTGTDYCVDLLDAASQVLASTCFDLTFYDEHNGFDLPLEGFNTAIPYQANVNQVVLRKGALTLAVQDVSLYAPVVTVDYPNGGESWVTGQTYTITWTASDLDNDELTFKVLYTADGVNWLPIATDLTGNSLETSAEFLQGSESARIRVIASDGFNTVYDDSDAVFTIERKPPRASISSPDEANIVQPDNFLIFEGSAFDFEDGVIDPTSLQWSSDLDGVIGSGDTLFGVLTTSGLHHVTLTATDSDANTGTDVTPIIVRDPNSSYIISFGSAYNAYLLAGNSAPQVTFTVKLPSSCVKFSGMEQYRIDNKIWVSVLTSTPSNKVCSATSKSVTYTFPLEGEFPDGDYTMILNGESIEFNPATLPIKVTPTPTDTPTPTPTETPTEIPTETPTATATPVTDFVVNTTNDNPDADLNDPTCADSNGDCTLRAAFEQKNWTGGSSIYIPAGIYILTSGADINVSGDLTIIGAGASQTIIDGNNTSRIIDFLSKYGTYSVTGITFQNGNASGTDDYGGAIYNEGNLTLTDCVIKNNHADGGGGGIYSANGSDTAVLMLNNTTVENNTSSYEGGGLYVSDTATLIESMIKGNDASTGNGTGIRSNGANITIQGSLVMGNNNIGGEAIYHTNPATLLIEDSTISSNQGTGLFVGNYTTNTIVNSTIANNTRWGIIIQEANVTLINVILSGNVSDNCSFYVNGTVSSSYSLEYGTSCGLSGTGDQSNTDPKLGVLQDNGGSTFTHALLAGSPAIDTGDNANCTAQDQRGTTRPIDGDSNGTATCDIGAYEAPSGSASLPNSPIAIRLSETLSKFTRWFQNSLGY